MQLVPPVVRPARGGSTRGRRRRRQRPLVYAALVVLAALFVAPIVWLVDTALKAPGEVSAYPLHWVPDVPRWDNFVHAVTYFDFFAYARNSVFLSTVNATLVTLSSAFVGFGMARLRGPGKRVVFGLMISTLMLPTLVMFIPTYLLFARLHVIDTYWPWVLWGLGSSTFLVFLFRQFFTSIPTELEDAAIVDGCGYLRMFWRVFLPLSKPALATSFVLSFTGVWGDWLGPLLFLSENHWTLAVAVTDLYRDPVTHRPIVHLSAAGSILYALPVLAMYALVQRQFTKSLVTSGIK